MLPTMPATALIRNLTRFAKLGLTDPMSKGQQIIVERLADAEWLRKSRIHPLKVLVAQSIYDKGFSPSRPRRDGNGWYDHLVDVRERKERQWEPNSAVSNALDNAFYTTFDHVEPSGKRCGLFLDVSGSMDAGGLCGSFVNPRQASTALALVTMERETSWCVGAFSDGSRGWGFGGDRNIITMLPFKRGMRLQDATRITDGLRFGATDCALPILWALKNKVVLDVFQIYTDNESYAGNIHVSQALRQYRNEVNPQAKLVAIAMTATEYSVADQDDAGMLDIVGFDTSTPASIADFISG